MKLNRLSLQDKLSHRSIESQFPQGLQVQLGVGLLMIVKYCSSNRVQKSQKLKNNHILTILGNKTTTSGEQKANTVAIQVIINFILPIDTMPSSKILITITLLQAVISSVIQTIPQSFSTNYYQQLYRNYIIETNRQRIQSSNQQTLNFTLSVNKFIVYTQDEFEKLYLTTRVSDMVQVVTPLRAQTTKNNLNFQYNSILSNPLFYTAVSNDFIDIDWTRSGMITPIKNQGGCGSCWAFAAVSDLQSAYLINGYRGSLDLSQQQLVDCSGTFFNFGCAGGWMTNAYAYIYKNPITTEAAYPYTGTMNTCKNLSGTFSIKNLRSYWQNKNCQLLVDILKIRPASVAVAADSFYWGFYKSGVLNQCSSNINHGVNLVGVKKSATENYWRVKNSWGVDWGENGYVNIDRSQNNGNLCDICSYPQYAIV